MFVLKATEEQRINMMMAEKHKIRWMMQMVALEKDTQKNGLPRCPLSSFAPAYTCGFAQS